MINMLFLTRLKILLRRKETIFWTLLFPILLATAEYAAFGKFIHSNPLDTISLGVVEEEVYQLTESVETILTSAKLDEDTNLYKFVSYSTYEEALTSVKNDEIGLAIYQEDGEIKLIANETSTELEVTKNLIAQINAIESTIEDYYIQQIQAGVNPSTIDTEEIIGNLTKEASYIKDLSNDKNATFYTFYFYSLMAMACLYAALFGLPIITDIRADRSSLGIRISSSVVPKWRIILANFSAAMLLQMISSLILYVYLAFILKVSLGTHIGLILLTLILGGIAGLSMGMLVGAFVKSEKKSEGVITIVTLTLCVLAGLMSVEVKHLVVDKYCSFINWINPASLITNSLYALYYYDTFQNYILYTCILAAFSIVVLGIVIIKTRGEKYASL